MKIYLPTKITSSIDGYELLLRFQNDLSQLQNTTIEISFLNIQWFEANLVAVLGAIIEYLESKGNTIRIVEYETFIEKTDILFRNKFFPQHRVSTDRPLLDSSTQIPYKKFKDYEESLYNDYIQNELLNNTDFPRHSTRLGREIRRSIFELFENARTHGKCNYIHTCGQFFPTKKKLNITIVDTGKTIVGNVQEYLGKNKNSSDCIDWAMKMNNTTKTGDIPGGLGLGLIFEFININKGKIQVISSNGYWELTNGSVFYTDINFSFSGTIVNLEFILKEGETYRFHDEPIVF